MAPSATPAAQASSGTQREARRLIRWLLVPILGLLAVLSVLQYRQGLDDAEGELRRRADERAQELLALAEPAVAHVHDMRRLLEEAWDVPPAAPAELRSAVKPWGTQPSPGATHARVRAAPPTPKPPDGWTLDAATPAQQERYGQLWWGSSQGEPPSDLWLNRFALLQRSARVVQERTPGFEGSYFVSVERNVSWSYPWTSTPQMLQAMGVDSLAALDALRVASFDGGAQRLTSVDRHPAARAPGGAARTGHAGAAGGAARDRASSAAGCRAEV
jgi:hypothetical protein